MGSLTDTAVRNVKPAEKACKVFDGDGLFLQERARLMSAEAILHCAVLVRVFQLKHSGQFFVKALSPPAHFLAWVWVEGVS
jgi:hypothetical protein